MARKWYIQFRYLKHLIWYCADAYNKAHLVHPNQKGTTLCGKPTNVNWQTLKRVGVGKACRSCMSARKTIIATVNHPGGRP